MLTNIRTSFALRIPQSWIVIAFEVFLILLLAQQSARLVWTLIPTEKPKDSRWIIESSLNKNSDNTPKYTRLKELDAFGKMAMDNPIEIASVIPSSRLQVRIKGLLISNIPSHSLVILSEGSGENTYRIGDNLQSTNASITAIHPDRVIIKTSVRHEAITLNPDQRNLNLAQRKTISKNKNNHQAVAEVKALIKSNPASLMEIIRISPVKKNGKLFGYRVTPGSRPDLFKAAGLHNGDIALSINEYDLTQNSEAMRLMQNLPQLDRISLSVNRQGQIYQIDLSS